MTDTSPGASEEPLTTEAFYYVCKQIGLSVDDLEIMTVGSCLDFFAEHEEAQNPSKQKKARKAGQTDFDAF